MSGHSDGIEINDASAANRKAESLKQRIACAVLPYSTKDQLLANVSAARIDRSTQLAALTKVEGTVLDLLYDAAIREAVLYLCTQVRVPASNELAPHLLAFLRDTDDLQSRIDREERFRVLERLFWNLLEQPKQVRCYNCLNTAHDNYVQWMRESDTANQFSRIRQNLSGVALEVKDAKPEAIAKCFHSQFKSRKDQARDPLAVFTPAFGQSETRKEYELNGQNAVQENLSKEEFVEIMDYCVQYAEALGNDAFFFGNMSPNWHNCNRKSIGGETEGALAGKFKHGRAEQCVRQSMNGHQIANGDYDFKVEATYKLDPEQPGGIAYLGENEEGVNTWRCDVILHAKDQPTNIECIYDFKFPCPPTNCAAWGTATDRGTFRGLVQDVKYYLTLKPRQYPQLIRPWGTCVPVEVQSGQDAKRPRTPEPEKSSDK